MKNHFPLLYILLAFLVFSSCRQDVGEFVEDRRIIQILEENQNFSIFTEGIYYADLAEELGADGPFTVFAPTNDAMEAYFTAHSISQQEWMAQPEFRDIMLYHIMAGELLSDQIPNAAMETLLPNENITFEITESNITLNQSAIILTPDVEAANGVIHGIDQLLMPPGDTFF